MADNCTGWVLSGGGAKGSIQLGMMQVLRESGIVPDFLYGTSVGSLNALGYNYLGIEGLTKMWHEIEADGDILSLNIFRLLTLRAKGVYSTDPLREKVEWIVKNHKPTVKSASCYVDLNSGETRYSYNSGKDYIDATVASSSIPGVMDPVHMESGPAVDGGVTESAPLRQAILDGCDKIYVLLCSPLTGVEPWKEPGFPMPLVGYLDRAISIMTTEIMKNDIKKCNARNADGTYKKIDLKVYAPARFDVIDTLDFDPEKIRAGIEYGRSLVKESE